MHSTIKKNPLGFFPACIGVEFLCLSIYVFPCPNVHIMNVMVYAKTLPPGFVGRPVGLESTALPKARPQTCGRRLRLFVPKPDRSCEATDQYPPTGQQKPPEETCWEGIRSTGRTMMGRIRGSAPERIELSRVPETPCRREADASVKAGCGWYPQGDSKRKRTDSRS